MGKTALFAISAFIIMGAFYGMNTSSGLLATEDEMASNDYQVLARNAALAGFNVAKQKLADNFVVEPSFSGDYHGGGYFVRMQASAPNQITVTSVGSAELPDGTFQDYKIVAKFEKRSVGSDEVSAAVPQFMEYALISDKDLTLNGNVTIDTVRVVGQDYGAFNANVHTNGKLTVNGKVTVRGFGTYKTTRTFNPNQPSRFFKPYDNPANEPVAKQVPDGIDIPLATMTPAALNAVLPPTITTGSVTLNGNQDFIVKGATRENPYVWYVDGSLTLNGNVKMIGYVIFVVRDDIILNGNVSIKTGLGPTENTLALYACRDITLSGTVDVLWGQIFAAGNFTMNGTTKINGNVVVGGTATLNGKPDINYYPPSPALTKHFQPPVAVEKIEMITYHEDVV